MKRTGTTMKRMMKAVWAGVLVATMLPAAAAAQEKPEETPRPIPAMFASLYRTGKAIQAATEVGVNEFRFSQLLGEVATEVEIAKDHAKSTQELAIVKQYQKAVDTYAYVVDCCWTTSENSHIRDLFSQLLTRCGYEMENAHRLARGLKVIDFSAVVDTERKQ